MVLSIVYDHQENLLLQLECYCLHPLRHMRDGMLLLWTSATNVVRSAVCGILQAHHTFSVRDCLRIIVVLVRPLRICFGGLCLHSAHRFFLCRSSFCHYCSSMP